MTKIDFSQRLAGRAATKQQEAPGTLVLGKVVEKINHKNLKFIGIRI
jgi:hypothetical protein